MILCSSLGKVSAKTCLISIAKQSAFYEEFMNFRPLVHDFLKIQWLAEFLSSSQCFLKLRLLYLLSKAFPVLDNNNVWFVESVFFTIPKESIVPVLASIVGELPLDMRRISKRVELARAVGVIFVLLNIKMFQHKHERTYTPPQKTHNLKTECLFHYFVCCF